MTRDAVELLACETCGGNDRDAHGRTRGQRLLSALETVRDTREGDTVQLGTVRCLWACKRSCAVHVRGPHRAGYVLVELEPNDDNARALLDYARMYTASADGAVPFKQWPQPLKGHFLCRTPPVPEYTEENA